MSKARPRIYIVDTGYLIPYYCVKGTEEEFAEVKRRFELARDSNHMLVVPWPVLFELAAHVAEDHCDLNQVRACAIEVAEDIKLAVTQSDDRLFTVSPLPKPEQVAELLDVYATLGDDGKSGFAGRGFSLVDTAVYLAAQDWHARSGATHDVIIWTWERRRSNLRSYSPAHEPDPYPPWVD